MAALTLIVGGVLWTLVAFVWVARREARAHAARFEGLTLAQPPLDDGVFVAIRGDASSSAPAKDPVTGDDVAWWEARLERVSPGGARETLLTTEESGALEVRGVPVSLAGGVEIGGDPGPIETAEGTPSEAMRALLEDTPHALPPADETKPERGVRWELTVRRIAIGDALTVIGVAVGDPPTFDATYGPVVVTPASLEEVARAERSAMAQLDRTLAITAALGAVAIAIGLWLVA